MEAQIGIGMVCPFDMALDRELWRWMPDAVSLYFTRTGFIDAPVDVELCRDLNNHAEITAAVRAVASVGPQAFGYACASGSFVYGLAGAVEISNCMRAAGAERAVTTSEALLRALDAMNIGRLAVATPYTSSLTGLLCDFLAESGRSVVSQAGLGRDHRIWTIPYEVTAALIRAADHPEADAVFVSCTNLWTYDILAEMEAELGKPVLSANQVTAWATLVDAGVIGGERIPMAATHTAHRQSLFARNMAA
ncbi:Asp/Glu/hydantoin racemase [Gordonia bronchialis DSM 43247]|uniref:Asp/Glu/hydantoin racemase n=1 Tax=Gordonia bronchialis (strain ATCC 25592 / DSM 43247 / BCRC 13721 / JCM 3198 / KCTC 3076 / NBRC 16047 / NCTC 10667) TaxID=526226 RepID=D0L4N6_GORB4|nr:Asp/Glu/hydantoin racemase [Gordonia bronchialis]ACY23261.1 Asp/Glu/hydantoin racemase [Gordonia bronchialis DSM 43247]MCC3321429.1 Asp/Glu/hydantoin racemase [Gordonia bronchialis]QGS23347.1 Asp/Glu/hydantoin racemase [Gordonia bronchialis]UAK36291.1 Asp/Glu/hydantoin racemase [Gordonia bronchialis]STQ66229.1 Arylmalonate decarboxylase [Gordonia bronchialis]